MRQVRSLSNTCSTVTTTVVQSGASRQEHQKKEIHTTKETTNSAAKKNNQLYNILKKTLFPFQTDKVLKESLHMFDAHKNKSMNNVIAYIAPKNKTMSHIMILNNKISFVVGISIFGFNIYWKVFNLMEIQTS